MDRPDEHGTPYRHHLRDVLRKAQRKGDTARAGATLRELGNPHSYPEPLRYLHEIALEVYGRSGIAEGGVMPLSPVVLKAHCEAEDVTLTAEERRAIYAIDAALASRDEEPST